MTRAQVISALLDLVTIDAPVVTDTIAVGASPVGVAVSPYGTHLSVTDSSLNGHLWVVDTATGTATPTTVFFPDHGLSAVTLSPDGSRAYVLASDPPSTARTPAGKPCTGAERTPSHDITETSASHRGHPH